MEQNGREGPAVCAAGNHRRCIEPTRVKRRRHVLEFRADFLLATPRWI